MKFEVFMKTSSNCAMFSSHTMEASKYSTLALLLKRICQFWNVSPQNARLFKEVPERGLEPLCDKDQTLALEGRILSVYTIYIVDAQLYDDQRLFLDTRQDSSYNFSDTLPVLPEQEPSTRDCTSPQSPASTRRDSGPVSPPISSPPVSAAPPEEEPRPPPNKRAKIHFTIQHPKPPVAHKPVIFEDTAPSNNKMGHNQYFQHAQQSPPVIPALKSAQSATVKVTADSSSYKAASPERSRPTQQLNTGPVTRSQFTPKGLTGLVNLGNTYR